MSRVPPAYPLAALAAFLALLVLVATGWPPAHAVDVAVSTRARTFGAGNPGWIGVVRILTGAGATAVFVPAAGTLSIGLAVRRRYAAAAGGALLTAAVPVCWGLAHRLVHHPRPVDAFVIADGNGFPSGHTANASALALFVVLLLWPRLRRPGRVLALAAALLFAAAVAVSRVLLLAHWPWDVVGGALLAGGLVPLCAAAGAALTRRPREMPAPGGSTSPRTDTGSHR